MSEENTFFFDNISDDLNYYLIKKIINYLDKLSIKNLSKTNFINKISIFQNKIKKIIKNKLYNFKCEIIINSPDYHNEYDPFINFVKFNNNSTKILYSSSLPNEIGLYNIDTNDRGIIFFSNDVEINSVSFNKECTKIIYCLDNKKIYVWDIITKKNILLLNEIANSVEFINNSKKVISCSNERISIWDVDENSKNYKMCILTLEGHNDLIYLTKLNTNNNKILSVSDDYSIYTWDIDEKSENYGKLLKKLLGHKDYIYNAEFNNNDTRIVSGSDDNTIRIWNVNENENTYGVCILILKYNDDNFCSVKFNNDDTKILSGSENGQIIIWNVDEESEEYGKYILHLKGSYINDTINDVEFNNDNTKFVSCSNSTIRIWEFVD